MVGYFQCAILLSSLLTKEAYVRRQASLFLQKLPLRRNVGAPLPSEYLRRNSGIMKGKFLELDGRTSCKIFVL